MKWAALLAMLAAGCYLPPKRVTIRTHTGVPLMHINTETGDAELTEIGMILLRTEFRR